jgi:hypothetical protein
MELNAQIDALRMETSNHGNKGNSLFSEVSPATMEPRETLSFLKYVLSIRHNN